MCRRNLVTGCILAAFGTGMLIGMWVSADFLCYCLAIGSVLLGIACLKKK